jgi:cellulose synthase operon protein YhjQ
MDSGGTEAGDEQAVAGMPEDVAALYLWANLQGAKYRDFSASRREYRAQVRYRAAQTLRERELRAQAEAEASAAAAERAEVDALAEARMQDASDSQALHMQSMESAEEATRTASAERVEAARRAEAAAHAAAVVLREEREIVAAQASATRQALRYAESEVRRRQLAGPQPRGPAPDGGTMDGGTMDGGTMDGARERVSWEELQPSGTEVVGTDAEGADAEGSDAEGADAEAGPAAPAWLYASQTPPQTRLTQAIAQAYRGATPGGQGEAPEGETLQDSRERVAARWFALKGVFEQAGPELPAMQPARPGDGRTPLLAVFSLAGGVGKTSLAATLGRALSWQGEKVVLIDTTSRGLLPFYFGAREIRSGEVRTFLPSPGSTGAPISLVIHDAARMREDERQQETLTEEILRNGQGNQRVVLDLSSGPSWLLRRMVDLHPIVLVPMTGDMNSVMSLHAVERVFQSIVDCEGRPLLPYYVLNQFDASLPLHLDVREVLRRQLGDRLLRFVIRRSPAVSEALAEGMTVLDYAPDAPVSQDYMDVAAWLRSISPPATAVYPNLQWSER